YWSGNRPHVLAGDVLPAVEYGPGFCRQDQALTGPRPGPPVHVIAHEIGNLAMSLPSGTGEAHRVPDHERRDRNATDHALHRQQFLGPDDLIELRAPVGGRGFDDVEFLVLGGVIDADVEHEA